jgi:hypothetical protein
VSIPVIIIIYQVSKFMFSCIILDENVSCEIYLSPGNSYDQWTLLLFSENYWAFSFPLKYLLTGILGKEFVL